MKKSSESRQTDEELMSQPHNYDYCYYLKVKPANLNTI